MSISGYLKGYWQPVLRAWTLDRLRKTPARISLERSNWSQSLKDPTAFYLECTRFFQQSLPRELKEHRAYFHNVPGNRRGYGEDAFHVMWHLLFQEFRPAKFLEIGVFRGQVLSLASLLARLNGMDCQVHGISPFSPAGDAVSTYRKDLNYYEDTLENFAHFNLPRPQLLRAYSTDPEAVKLIKSLAWEMIYIDGNHDYEVARQDWEVCSQSARPGGIIVLDDAGLNTAYRPPGCLGTRGHPGPSRLADEIDRSRFRELLQVGHNRAFQKIG